MQTQLYPVNLVPSENGAPFPWFWLDSAQEISGVFVYVILLLSCRAWPASDARVPVCLSVSFLLRRHFIPSESIGRNQ